MLNAAKTITVRSNEYDGEDMHLNHNVFFLNTDTEVQVTKPGIIIKGIIKVIWTSLQMTLSLMMQ